MSFERYTVLMSLSAVQADILLLIKCDRVYYSKRGLLLSLADAVTISGGKRSESGGSAAARSGVDHLYKETKSQYDLK